MGVKHYVVRVLFKHFYGKPPGKKRSTCSFDETPGASCVLHFMKQMVVKLFEVMVANQILLLRKALDE